jgi:hypothetical protein
MCVSGESFFGKSMVLGFKDGRTLSLATLWSKRKEYCFSLAIGVKRSRVEKNSPLLLLGGGNTHTPCAVG